MQEELLPVINYHVFDSIADMYHVEDWNHFGANHTIFRFGIPFNINDYGNSDLLILDKSSLIAYK